MDPSQRIREHLPGVRDVTIVDGAGRPPLCVVVVADVDGDRAALADAVVRCAARDGLTVRPAVYTASEWDALRASADDDTWRATLGADGAVVGAVVALHCQRAPRPRASRAMLLRVLSGYRQTLNAVADGPPLLQHVTLGVCASAVAHAMAALFAARGLRWTDDGAAVATFDAEFARAGRFDVRQATLPARLVGLARQAEHAYWITGRNDDRRFRADGQVDEAREFVGRVEEYVATTLTDDAERTGGKRSRRLLWAVIGPAVVLLWFARFFVTRPERPTANLGAITAPGAITGEYFVGGNLERKAFERADKTIEFAFASGALDPRLGDETFSVRWTGFLFFDQPGRWHLCGQVDDGVRIFFDDRALVDDWERQAVRTVCGTVTVEPGWYPLRVEYRRGAGGGAITLLRGPPRRGLEVVPPWLLCCGRPGEAPASERSARAELR